jgi:hypothetical protein
MQDKTDFPRGTPALMVLKTLPLLGLLHGYGIGRAESTNAKLQRSHGQYV